MQKKKIEELSSKHYGKTKRELEELKKQVETLKTRLNELDEDEIRSIVGGVDIEDIEHYTEWEVIPTIDTQGNR